MTISRSRLAVLLLSVLSVSPWWTSPALAQTKAPEPGGEKKRDPAYEKVTDDPKLPRVLLIGDSISIGYTLPARDLLKGKANVHRILTNGGPTTNGVKNLDQWLGDAKWDVIHFNFGLHDLKQIDGKHQVPLADYEKLLTTIVERLKKTNAKLIWATTAPVPDAKQNPPRDTKDVLAYNAAAARVMSAHGIPIDDLYTTAIPKLDKIQRPANVHFTPAGYKLLAEQVATSIEAALK